MGDDLKRALSGLKHDLDALNPTTRHAFLKEFEELSRQSEGRERFALSREDVRIISDERKGRTEFDAHYIYHLAWAARMLQRTRPPKHVDISSSLYFPAMMSAFIPFESYEYQPSGLRLDNLRTGKADLLELPFEDGSIGSLSCMHVLEHVGLGRYGDPVDYDGDIKAAKELQRVLAPGGNLLLVVPVGRPRIEFNAHRIYGHDLVLGLFPGLHLKEKALICDNHDDGLISDPPSSDFTCQRYGCGCFRFTKPSP